MNTKKLLLDVLLAAAFTPVAAFAFDGDQEPRIEQRVVLHCFDAGRKSIADPLLPVNRRPL